MPQPHTTADQVKFLSEWFTSWSEMQKEDFMPVLMQAYQPKDHLNGLVGGYDSLKTQGRRPSLFDCQMKLFQDWFTAWTEGERQALLDHLREVDGEFMEQYETKLKDDGTHPHHRQEQEEQVTVVVESGIGEVTVVEASGGGDGCGDGCGDGGGDGHNASSSVNSPAAPPPITLPPSSSPHDSGLDEPTESDNPDPQSSPDASLETTATNPAVTQVVVVDDPSPTPTPPPLTPTSAAGGGGGGKVTINVTTNKTEVVDGEGVFNMDEVVNGLATATATATATAAATQNTTVIAVGGGGGAGDDKPVETTTTTSTSVTVNDEVVN